MVRVTRDSSGVWSCRPYLGRDALGKPIRPYRRFPDAADEDEARAMAEEWVRGLGASGRRASTLSSLLAEYVAIAERNGYSPNSVRSYRLFASYVARLLGNARASEVSVDDMTRFEQRLLAPESEGGLGLSRNTVIDVHMFLRKAFAWIASVGGCDENPMLSVPKPSPERHEAASLDEWDLADLAGAISEAMHGPVESDADWRRCVAAFGAWVALTTGMRCGEVCALRRRDFDLSRLYVHVGGTVMETGGHGPWRRDVTKGRRCRNVAITENDALEVVAFVDRQRERVGRAPSSGPLVTVDGRWMGPTRLNAEFRRIRMGCGLPDGVTFHTLRHTHATWCLAHGVDVKTLSERLGHADEATTLRIYAHVMPGRDAAAAKAFEDAAPVPKACQPAERPGHADGPGTTR